MLARLDRVRHRCITEAKGRVSASRVVASLCLPQTQKPEAARSMQSMPKSHHKPNATFPLYRRTKQRPSSQEIRNGISLSFLYLCVLVRWYMFSVFKATILKGEGTQYQIDAKPIVSSQASTYPCTYDLIRLKLISSYSSYSSFFFVRLFLLLPCRPSYLFFSDFLFSPKTGVARSQMSPLVLFCDQVLL